MPEQRSRVMNALAASKLFHGLDDDALGCIADGFSFVKFDDGDAVFHQNDDADYLYIIENGSAAIFKKMGQGERRVGALGPGEHFGEMAMISSEKRNATVRAEGELCCVRMDAKGFDALIGEDARFAQRMLNALSERLRASDEIAIGEMVRAHQALTFSLAKLADSRDPETGAHLYRVRAYCQLLSDLLREHPAYRDVIDDEFIENIYLVSPLHDIGKVAIPDGVLLKKGRFTDAEFQIMTSHTTLGAHAVDTVLKYCDLEMFQMARRLILCHHECWDGKGYPSGIAGEEIPVEARIMALADNYDALLSERVYKPAFTYEQTLEELEKCKGTRFDPVMAQVMIDNIDKFQELHAAITEESAELV